MKKSLLIFAVAAVLVGATTRANAAVNQKVLTSFKSVFVHASNVNWYEYSDHFQASFNQDGMMIKVSYDKEGNLLNSIRYYKEQQLPLNILYRVKKKYADKKVDIVTEVSNADGTVFFIQLEDAKSFTIVKTDSSGEMTVTDSFNKIP